MVKKLVVKNIENKKYFTDDYDCFWHLDIKYSRTFDNEQEVEKEINRFADPEGTNAFENVTSVIIETIYFL